jgi:hypothetical protein
VVRRSNESLKANRDSQSSGLASRVASREAPSYSKAPPEELQSFKVASVFGSFTIQEPNLDGWPEATAEATLKPPFEASSDCP